jgi:UV radiation resistance-associated gene protein
MTAPPPSDSACVDDMELTLVNRRRSRRISTTSLGTLRRSMRANSDPHRGEVDLVTNDGANLGQGDWASPTSGRPRANSRTVRKGIPSSYMSRPQPRERTISSLSTQSLLKATNASSSSASATAFPYGDAVSPPTSPIVRPTPTDDDDHLQRSLEHVVASRLVETFLSLEVWDGSMDKRALSTTSPLHSPIHSKVENPFSARIRSSSASSHVSLRNPSVRSPSRQSNTVASRSSRPSSPVNATTSTPIQKFKPHPTQSPRLRRIDEPSHAATSSVNTNHNLPTPAPSPPPDGNGTNEEVTTAPFYISPFHRPSTNPAFTSLDVNRDFAPWADLGACRFRASIWGKKGSDWGKGKNDPLKPEESPLYSSLEEKHEQEQEWEILASWDVDMDELVPLSAEVHILTLYCYSILIHFVL